MTSGVGRSFSFFTELTYWGIAFYTLFAGFHTLIYAIRGRAPLESWPRILQVLYSFFYTTIITFPFLVTIVYWVLLYSSPYYSRSVDQWRDISKHGLNSLVALFEYVGPTATEVSFTNPSRLIFPDTRPPPFLHLLGLILILALYLCLAYITHETQGFYPYAFLDPADGSARLAGYIIGILAAAVIIFIIVWGLVWLRRRFTPAGKRSAKEPAAATHDVEMSSTATSK
jgi:hypothetical protein